MTPRRHMGIVAMTIMALAAVAGAESASVLLEKGIHQEEAIGDIQAAMGTYRKIVEDARADRKYVAEALYRLGVCQLKAGRAGRAVASMEELVRRFPDQKKLLPRAQRFLAAHGGANNRGPKIVQTSPSNFATDVPATPQTISVTFDRQMADRSWSWVRADHGTFPKITGKPSYDAGRTTCSIRVTLEPGTVYWIGINTPPYRNFVDGQGAVAPQHVLLFATASADGKATPIPESLRARAKAIIASAGRAAPRVVATDPKCLANDVPASAKALSATFDQEMMGRSWSWVQRDKDTFPQMDGKPSYDAARKTCSLPVKLRPGTVYWVGINSQKHRSFQTAAKKPAKPYVLLFATRGADGKPTEIPAELVRRARAVNGPSASDKAAQVLATRGWKLWGARKLAEAESLFRQAVAKDATNAHLWNGLGWALQNQGKHAAAKAFDRCLALEPTHAGALNGLGWIARIRKDNDKAIGYWKRAVEAMPTATAALNGLADTLTELGKHAEAVRYYEMWLKVEPNNAQVKAALAKARKAAGHPAKERR